MMRINQEITERIRYVERFEIIVSGKSRHLTSEEYPFSRAANRQMPVSKWLETRFQQTYPTFNASVIYPNGLTVRPDIPIGVVRDLYENCSSLYGQTLRFKFTGNDESSIIKLKIALDKAGINTELKNPSFLFLWDWFYLKGEISHIHLPFAYRLAIPAMLSSFNNSKEICFEYEFSSDNCHLFEVGSNYHFWGMENFKSLKGITGWNKF